MHRREALERVGGWPRWEEHGRQPIVVLEDRFQDAGLRFEPVWALTAFKPPATFRPGSYVERPSHEQREYARRIRDAAAELRQLLDERRWRRELGDAARANVAAHFTWDACGRATVAAYAEALR
jgi:glycosyltransferase involved in cell wall biosynthesis